MEHQDKGWANLGKTLLIAAMGHGWVALLIFLSIIAMTYVAAYFLVSAIKGREGEGIAIITPFLKIKTQPPDNHDQQKLPKLSDDIKGFMSRYKGTNLSHKPSLLIRTTPTTLP
jgi:hypothetical protein